jgi:hypothetical protein
MSSANYDSRYFHQQHPRQHDSYYPSAQEKRTIMRNSANASPYPSPSSSFSNTSHDYHPYEGRAPQLPARAAAPPQYPYPYPHPYPSRSGPRKPTWPPSPSVEDETASLTKEVVSPVELQLQTHDGEPPIHTRGTVDQEKVLEEIHTPDDRRYVLVSDPSASTTRDRRRRSYAERGNMAPIKTDVDDPPVYTERISTPYAYTKPQKESTTPSHAEFLSPEPLTPASASVSRSLPSRDASDAQRDQNTKPQRPTPSSNPHDTISTSPPTAGTDVFDDSDAESDGVTHLHTAERKPARYSFVKSDLQKEDLRTNLYNHQPKPEPRRRESGQRKPPAFHKHDSSGSSKDYTYVQSPRSSSSSLNSGDRIQKSATIDPGYYHSTSRTPSRPSSPLQREPSPRLPSRLGKSPPTSRPQSRGYARAASPVSFSSTGRPPSPGRVSVTDADWHATYPPVTTHDRSRPPSRMNRYDTMPETTPRIDVKSPSPVRPFVEGGALPYPVDDRPLDVFMPLEEHYQFDHSKVASSRQILPESPRITSSPNSGSPRLRNEAHHPKSNIIMPEELTRTRKTRSNSVRSQASTDSRREQPVKPSARFDLDKPLPSCPRSAPSTKYDDWYSFQGYRNFDICPSCFKGVFAGTPFAVNFSQTRIGERPTERFCDFSSPWIRLAWLLTIKQRRSSLELIYALADITDIDRPCPEDREVSGDRVTWYGIPDQRDGIHVANFSICSCDKRMIEALLPTMRGYFTRLPSTYSPNGPQKHICSLRTSSRRFPRYLDLLVELDTEAHDLGNRPHINRFIQMARENAFKSECGKGKCYIRKPWHFIPSLPEFTVCEECYDELVWPAYQSKNTPTTIPRLFNKAIQLVPNEDSEIGSSCCLYSPRMRRVFDTSVREVDLAYLKRKAIDRKRAEVRIAKEKKGIVNWMVGLDRGSSQWERSKTEIKALEREWASWE